MRLKKLLNDYIIIKNIDTFKPENRKFGIFNDLNADVGYVLKSNCEEYKVNDIVIYNSKNAKITKMDFLIKGSQEVAIFKEDIVCKIIE